MPFTSRTVIQKLISTVGQPNKIMSCGRVTRTFTCHICGTIFTSHHTGGKYCSPTCSRMGERKSWNKYSKKNKTARLASSKRIYQNNRIAVIKRTSAYSKTEAGKRARDIAMRNQKIKNPHKIKARWLVHGALETGKLVKSPCEKCGNTKVQAHHDDYSKPLDVRWLCHPCHCKEHGHEPLLESAA